MAGQCLVRSDWSDVGPTTLPLELSCLGVEAVSHIDNGETGLGIGPTIGLLGHSQEG